MFVQIFKHFTPFFMTFSINKPKTTKLLRFRATYPPVNAVKNLTLIFGIEKITLKGLNCMMFSLKTFRP